MIPITGKAATAKPFAADCLLAISRIKSRGQAAFCYGMTTKFADFLKEPLPALAACIAKNGIGKLGTTQNHARRAFHMGDRKNWLVWMVKMTGWLVLSPFFRLKIEGTEKIPKEHAFVLLPKHQRWEDIPLIGIATPRPLYYVAKFELFRNPISRCFLKSLGGIPLNRQRPMESRDSLNMVINLLEKREGVVIFPEGTYYRNRMGPGYTGMIRLILSRSSPPFIPVGVNYTRRGLRTLAKIKFGNAFYADTDISANGVLDHIMKDIADLSGLKP